MNIDSIFKVSGILLMSLATSIGVVAETDLVGVIAFLFLLMGMYLFYKADSREEVKE